MFCGLVQVVNLKQKLQKIRSRLVRNLLHLELGQGNCVTVINNEGVTQQQQQPTALVVGLEYFADQELHLTQVLKQDVIIIIIIMYVYGSVHR